jgi:hypothetical protein
MQSSQQPIPPGTQTTKEQQMKLKYANGKRVTKAQEFEFFRQIRLFQSMSKALADVERDENGNVLLWSAVNCMRSANIKFELLNNHVDWLNDNYGQPAIVDVDEDNAGATTNAS